MQVKHYAVVLWLLFGSIALTGASRLPTLAASSQLLHTTGVSQLDSALAQYYEIYASGFNFDQRIAQATAANDGHRPTQIEITKSLENKFVEHVSPSIIPAGSSPLLESAVNNSDLIVMGVPLTSYTLPVQDHTFLFTEYMVRIDRVMGAGHHSVQPGDTITVSHGGGELMVDGVLVKAVESAFEQFQLNRQYIFMLHAIPGTDAYRALGSRTFSVGNDGTVTTVSHLEAASEQKRDLNDFLSRLDTALARKPLRRN